jgi:hypothetical protein
MPGPDPGIQADAVGWGDPRITSGDDEDEKSADPPEPRRKIKFCSFIFDFKTI